MRATHVVSTGGSLQARPIHGVVGPRRAADADVQGKGSGSFSRQRMSQRGASGCDAIRAVSITYSVPAAIAKAELRALERGASIDGTFEVQGPPDDAQVARASRASATRCSFVVEYTDRDVHQFHPRVRNQSAVQRGATRCRARHFPTARHSIPDGQRRRCRWAVEGRVRALLEACRPKIEPFIW